MCDVAVPLPRCTDCNDAERAVLAEKLRLTPKHPLIEARLAQLDVDELLSVEALASLSARRVAAIEAGEDFRDLNRQETERHGMRRERELQARSHLVAIALTEDFGAYPLDLVLSAWASHPSPAVRRRVASNPKTPVKALEVLARDYDRDVLGAVMSNPAHGWGCFFRVAANPHAAGGMAEVLCLLTAATLPPAPDDREHVDAALAELSATEKLNIVRFLREV